jgi:hypothetical protein
MLLFIDGMAHYATEEIPRKYTVFNDGDTAGTSVWSVAPEGRFNNCLKRVVTGGGFASSGYVEATPLFDRRGPWTPTAGMVMGFALKVDDLDLVRTPGNHHYSTVLEIFEGTGRILYIVLNNTGTFSVYAHRALFTGDGAAYLGSSIQGLRSNQWAYVEVKLVVDAVAGLVQIRVNGTIVFSYSGDTRGSSYISAYSGIWTTARLLNLASSGLPMTTWLADLYIADLVSVVADDVSDFLGDVTIDYITSDGPGYLTEWDPAPVVANWENVNEVPPDEDTTYNSTAIVGERDSYTLQDVPVGSIILGYQALLYTRKETEGAAFLQFGLRPPGGVTYDTTRQGIPAVDEYRYLIWPYDVNPATLAKITEAEINASEGGMVKG